jgi:hypothetical protein
LSSARAQEHMLTFLSRSKLYDSNSDMYTSLSLDPELAVAVSELVGLDKVRPRPSDAWNPSCPCEAIAKSYVSTSAFKTHFFYIHHYAACTPSAATPGAQGVCDRTETSYRIMVVLRTTTTACTQWRPIMIHVTTFVHCPAETSSLSDHASAHRANCQVGASRVQVLHSC